MDKDLEGKFQDFDVYIDVATIEIEELAKKEANIELNCLDLNGLVSYVKYLEWLISNQDTEHFTNAQVTKLSIYYGELFIRIFGGEWTLASDKDDLGYGMPVVCGFTGSKEVAQYVMNVVASTLRKKRMRILFDAIESASEYSVKFKQTDDKTRAIMAELVKTESI